MEFIEVGTPLTHQHYLNAPHGEIYGLEHDQSRFSASNAARLRPTTPVRNLFMTGQDIVSCGWTGAMFSGLLTASAVLQRNLFIDLMAAKARSDRATNGHVNGSRKD